MCDHDDIDRNASAAEAAAATAASLAEQEALRQAGDPRRLELDRILHEMQRRAAAWAEAEGLHENNIRPIEDYRPEDVATRSAA